MDPTRPVLYGTSRRNFLRAVGVVTAAGMINACTSSSGASTTAAGAGAGGGAGAGDFPETPEWNFVFVNHVTTNPFFVPTVYGIEDASAILGTTFQWTGSEIADNGEMVNAFEAAIAAEADGIGIAIVDLEAFNGPTDEALAAGIPVLSYNADAPNNRLAYVGQDLYGSGFAMGQRIVELVGSGKVGLFIATPGQLNIQPRIDGALDAIAESGADIEALDIATGADLTEELSTVEAWYLGNQDATGMFAVDAGSTQAVGQVVRDQDARSNALVGAGGYDLLPETVELVSEGVLDFTIDQQPYLQGFLPVLYMYLYKLSGGVATPPETNTGLVFLDQTSAQLFLETTSRFEGDAEEQKILEPVA
ncbi:MAG: substrate-binding domain-containing protein [Actinomycetota bacterium]|nr:substrate-binding domain-containing protein [Actinomycetota bacterium]